MDTFQDKQMTCKDCGKEFVWTAGEQQFFAQKGFQNSPSRCPDCRRANKQNRQGMTREKFTIICSDCGKEGEVPFKPRDPNSPVYCADCFRNRRMGGAGQPAAEKPADNAGSDEEQAA